MIIRPLSILYRADVGFDGGLGIIAAQTCLSVQPHSQLAPRNDSPLFTDEEHKRELDPRLTAREALQRSHRPRSRTFHPLHDSG